MTTRSSWSRYRCPAGIGFMHSKKLPVLSDADAAALANEYAAEIRARRQAPAAAKDWISLVYRLPDGLRQVLLEELDRGNLLVEIAESSWPSPRCIIGTMRDRFHGDGRACPPRRRLAPGERHPAVAGERRRDPGRPGIPPDDLTPDSIHSDNSAKFASSTASCGSDFRPL